MKNLSCDFIFFPLRNNFFLKPKFCIRKGRPSAQDSPALHGSREGFLYAAIPVVSREAILMTRTHDLRSLWSNLLLRTKAHP